VQEIAYLGAGLFSIGRVMFQCAHEHKAAKFRVFIFFYYKTIAGKKKVKSIFGS